MTENRFSVVTGAFSYTGRYIAQRLLSDGERVKTLTAHPNRPDPFGGRVEAMPYNFDSPDELARSLEGADVFYNTYWVRFARGGVTHETAVRNEVEVRLQQANQPWDEMILTQTALPVDPRHNSKIDYAGLGRMLAENRLSTHSSRYSPK